MSRSLKRALDVTLAALGLVASAPVLALASVAIRLVMGRPVLFRQRRPGLHGRPFFLYKLRTMHESAGPDALRLTPLGRWLRRSSVDELPQLWNVLVGDMSLVGPRPLLMQYLPRYSAEQARRHEVKPGITGLAQVSGRNALSWEEKFALDVRYVDEWSLGLDARILLRTLGNVVSGHGISAGGEATMPEFLGSGEESERS